MKASSLVLSGLVLSCTSSPGEAPGQPTPLPQSQGDAGVTAGAGGNVASHAGSAGTSAGGNAGGGAGGNAGSGGSLPLGGAANGGNAGTSGCGSSASAGDSDVLSFGNFAIDDSFVGENKAIGDIDGDGLLDLLSGGGELRWYQAPSFTPHYVQGSGGYLTSHMQVADINADGALDVVTPDHFELYWFENPLGQGGDVDDVWPRHLLGENGALIHELEVADLNLDGKLDIVTNPSLKVWIQGATPTSFTMVDLAEFADTQGMAVGRIDADDRPDIAVRGQWVKTPVAATDPDAYVAYAVAQDMYWSSSISVADLDEDGKAELLYAPMESGIGDLLWFSASSPTGVWERHSLGEVSYVHNFVVTDIDQSGRPDILFAEMTPSCTRRVAAFLNDGDGQWSLDVIATTGSHNLVVGDLGNDCDLDFAGSNWDSPPLEVWENQASPAGTVCEP